MSSSVKYKAVANLLDNNIIKKLSEVGLLDIIDDLSERVIKFSGIIERDFKGVKVDAIQVDDFDKIESSKLKYYISYVYHCNKRIDDVKWILKNRGRFEKMKNLQVFNLLKLKERLSVENAVEIPFKKSKLEHIK